MFFKKNAFTLAEVLITLSIVGVVAALTMPALTKNVGGAKIGPQLSKFVNTFETATETMMLEENMSTLSGGNPSIEVSLYERLSKYMIMSQVPRGQGIIKITGALGGGSKNLGSDTGTRTWQLKDGTLMIAESLASGDSYKAQNAYKKALSTVYIDLGGINGKHRAGVEVFKFILDDTGTLVPYGGNTFNKLASKSLKCSRGSNSIESNLACTGAFADNSWKAPSNY